MVQRYLDEELASGAIGGSVQHSEAVYVSPFGQIKPTGQVAANCEPVVADRREC